MKTIKQIFLIIFCILGSQAWADMSATLPVDDNGNVGMGTTAPQAKLEIGTATSMIAGSSPEVAVDGNVYVDGTVYGTYFYGNGSLLTGVTSISGLTDHYIPRASSASTLENSIIYDSGTNIGISSAAPQAKLDVEGTVYLGNANVGIGTAIPTKQLELTQNMSIPTTQYSAQYGIIYKGTDPFIHNFTYGLNGGGITPTGNNTFVGVNAGNLTMGETAVAAWTSSANTAIGVEAFQANTIGSYDAAAGYRALYTNTTGAGMVANGANALYLNATGGYATAEGASALYKTTAGGNNAAGYAALYENTSGYYNIAFGANAGSYIADGATANSTGYNSVFLGVNTKALANGQPNQIVIGYDATGLGSNTAVLGNASIVTTALNGNVGVNSTAPQTVLDVSGAAFVDNGNVGIGTAHPQARLEAGAATPKIADSTPVALVDGNVYTDGTVYGTYLYGNGSLLTAVGISGLTDNYIPRAKGTTALENSIIYDSGTNIGISSAAPQAKLDVEGTVYLGNANVGIGTAIPTKQLELTQNMSIPTTQFSAQYGIIYKGADTFIHNFTYGLNGGGFTPTGRNTFVGVKAGNLTLGSTATAAVYSSMNTAAGYEVGQALTTGLYATGVGYQALYSNTTGSSMSAIGATAFYSSTTKGYGAALGSAALYNNAGDANVAAGYAALYGVTSGIYNVALGAQAGRYIADGATANSTGSNSVFLGVDTKALANGQNNQIVIGYNATGLGTNTAVLGNSSVETTVLRGNVGINSTAPQAVLDVSGIAFVDNGNLGIGTAHPVEQLELTQNMSMPTTQNSAKYGIIYKGEDTFIHDFNYGWNGSYTLSGQNTFVGVKAGNLTMGATATAGGYQSSGAHFVGYGSGVANTIGYYNNTLGARSLARNENGNANNVIGYNAHAGEVSQTGSVALGVDAGTYLTDGSTFNETARYSLYVGTDTKAKAAGGLYETVIGHEATGLGNYSVELGNSSVVTTALSGNVGINSTAPQARLDVEGITFVGGGNMGIGTATPIKQLELTQNMSMPTTQNSAQYGIVFKGTARFIHDFNYGYVDADTTTDGRNTFIGVNSGKLTMGSTATENFHASYNTGVGFEALQASTTGHYNTSIGYESGYAITSGAYNTTAGIWSLAATTTSSGNTVGGHAALFSACGNNNIALGYYAGTYITDGSTANAGASNSVFLGASTRALAITQTNQIVIGYLNTGLGSNTVTLGSSSIVTTSLQKNVGIGSTAPQAALDVEGGVLLATGNVGIGTAKPTKSLGIAGACIQLKSPDGSLSNCCVNNANAFSCTGV